MKEKVRFLGLDVHAETIAVAVAEPDGEVRSLGTIANRVESIRKLLIRPRWYATFSSLSPSKSVWRGLIRGSCRNRH